MSLPQTQSTSTSYLCYCIRVADQCAVQLGDDNSSTNQAGWQNSSLDPRLVDIPAMYANANNLTSYYALSQPTESREGVHLPFFLAFEPTASILQPITGYSTQSRGR